MNLCDIIQNFTREVCVTLLEGCAIKKMTDEVSNILLQWHL